MGVVGRLVFQTVVAEGTVATIGQRLCNRPSPTVQGKRLSCQRRGRTIEEHSCPCICYRDEK